MRKTGVLPTRVEIEVPFHDLDPMEVVWHGHYLKYFEIARCALLRRIDYDYPQMRASGYAWPIVDLQTRYVKGATFSQRLTVEASLIEWETRLVINYRITDAQTGERLTRGSTVQVAVDMRTRELCLVCPAILLERIHEALK